MAKDFWYLKIGLSFKIYFDYTIFDAIIFETFSNSNNSFFNSNNSKSNKYRQHFNHAAIKLVICIM